ncbi:hypothetical protein FRB91_004123 [Serendipita sp. 411]|nr:hypothetical protein FRC16_000341 [Serendipita sp. 398]KAG8854045.1 hypothetical protein FRB91_004123 [Serendipita sp. 411]
MSAIPSVHSIPQPSPLPFPISSSPLSQESPVTAWSSEVNEQAYTHGSLTKQNIVYIYSILLALLVILSIILAFLIRTLIRRRQRARQLAALEAMEQQQSNGSGEQTRRKKKHKHTKRPRLEDAWIGNGPLPISLSTDELLEVIQPFSLAETKTVSSIEEKKTIGYTIMDIPSEKLPQMKTKGSLRHMLSFPRLESASSCVDEDEKLPERPDTPPLYEIQHLRAGFLIAMPRPPPIPSSLRSRSTGNLSVFTPSRESDSDDWSVADSRLKDSYLWDGELPELSLGISTVCVPIPCPPPSPQPSIL